MKTRNILIILSMIAGVLFQSCNKKSTDDPPIANGGIISIEDVLNGQDQSLISILNKVRGSVGTRGPASKTIWSRKNDYGAGLYISANHVYGISGWNSRNAAFFNLFAENPGIFETSQIPPINGNIALGNTLIADFPFMHFDISPTATNTTILPSEDFYLGIIDNQRVEQSPFAQYPGLVQTATPLQMFDVDNRTKAVQTWNTPVAGEKLIVVGYPQDKIKYPNGAVANGKILTDAEAADAIRQLKAAGDPEGDVPYNPNAEFWVDAKAIAGMSGGGAFNAAAQLVGVMVRASDKENAPKIIRVVKLSYIRDKLVEFYHGLPEAEKNKVRPFISGEL